MVLKHHPFFVGNTGGGIMRFSLSKIRDLAREAKKRLEAEEKNEAVKDNPQPRNTLKRKGVNET